MLNQSKSHKKDTKNTLQRVTNHHETLKTRATQNRTSEHHENCTKKLSNSLEITSPVLKRGRQTTNILKNRITQTPTVPNQPNHAEEPSKPPPIKQKSQQTEQTMNFNTFSGFQNTANGLGSHKLQKTHQKQQDLILLEPLLDFWPEQLADIISVHL